MTDALFDELIAARESADTLRTGDGGGDSRIGSARSRREDAGLRRVAKFSGTIGGGKFEALVIEDASQAMREEKPLLKTYPLHEGDPESFGAICGGESRF